MKIINKTTWDSKDIREFANKVLKKEAHQLDTLVIKYQQGMVAGRGSYSRRWISLSFPNWKWEKIGSDRINGIKQPFQVIENDKLKAIAKTLRHEILHNRGIHHKDMDSARIRKADYSYIGDMVIRRKQIKDNTKIDLKQKRYEHSKLMLKHKQTQLKRLQNSIKKWQRKVKYEYQ